MDQLSLLLKHVEKNYFFLLMIVIDSPIRVILMPAAPKANATYWVCQLKPGHCLQSECYGIEASCAINCKNQVEFSILRPQDFGEDGIFFSEAPYTCYAV